MATKKKATTKRKLIAKYDLATIYFGDGEFWTFKLSEWTLYRDYDWVEVAKNDGTGMEMFCVPNVIRISFGMSTIKEVKSADVVSISQEPTLLKPIA